jgi:hypothetical protein
VKNVKGEVQNFLLIPLTLYSLLFLQEISSISLESSLRFLKTSPIHTAGPFTGDNVVEA